MIARRLLIGLVLALAISACSLLASEDDAARDALARLPQWVTSQNYNQLGFDSTKDAARAKLGDPMRVSYIGLDALKAYRRGQDVRKLLIPTTEVYYPVTVDGAVTTAITVAGDWRGHRLTGVGHALIIRRLTDYRKGLDAHDDIVRVPALGMYFLKRDTPRGVVLTAINAYPELAATMGAGTSRPADLVVADLVPLAAPLDGRTPN